jgi:hypothetical protein
MAVSPENRRRLAVAFRAYLQRTSKPILLGPYRSEVGFEALYLLPFLKWLLKGIDPSRLYVVTRGGAATLYGLPGIDLYDLRGVQTVRQENLYDAQKSGLQKQMASTAWDRDVLKEAAAHLLGRGASYLTVHPSWMYWALEPFWHEQRGMKYLASMTDYSPIPKVHTPPLDLPPQFVAMKWYTRPTFPPNDQAQAFVRDVTARIASQVPVVLLSSGHGGDDHTDLRIAGPNIANLPANIPPSQNLAVQIAVLSRAQGFVGTYGGMAQLALRLGVPSAGFYTEFGQTAFAHLSLSHHLSLRSKVPFVCGSLGDTDAWRQIVAGPVAKQEAA